MELNQVLVELGLSSGESKIYLALLRSGTSSVNEIKNLVKLHRPNIYDYLEKLIDKGLVNYITKNNVKHFTAVDPEKLVEYVEEKESLAKHYLSEFRKIQNKPQEEIKVEVYRGREGIKTLFNDLIRVGKNYVAFGVDESMWEEKFSILIKQHFRKEKKAKIKARILTSKNAKVIYKYGNYRFIDHKYFSENSTVIYGDRVCNIIWDP
ncbi:MAG TPA: helix-turn-helix domain-containing protein, partial [Candidatus Nanoarchaeia archaeon]|nr:helix-turn-helix domain-containing protein [Candidatus Nanoarchaeia archaeon]